MSHRNRNNRNRNDGPPPAITANDHAALLLMHKSGDNDLIEKVKKFVEANYRDITTSQLRNIYSQVKKASLQDLPLIRPKLAYIAGRTDTKKRGMHRLIDLLDELIQKVNDEEKLVGFKTFFESVLAYHKYYEKTQGRKIQ